MERDNDAFAEVERPLLGSMVCPGRTFYMKTPDACAFSMGDFTVFEQSEFSTKKLLTVAQPKKSKAGTADFVFDRLMAGIYYHPLSGSAGVDDGFVAQTRIAPIRKQWRMQFFGLEKRLNEQPHLDGSKHLYSWGEMLLLNDASENEAVVRLVTKVPPKGKERHNVLEDRYNLEKSGNHYSLMPIEPGPPLAVYSLAEKEYWTGSPLECLEIKPACCQDNALLVVIGYMLSQTPFFGM